MLVLGAVAADFHDRQPLCNGSSVVDTHTRLIIRNTPHDLKGRLPCTSPASRILALHLPIPHPFTSFCIAVLTNHFPSSTSVPLPRLRVPRDNMVPHAPFHELVLPQPRA